MDNIKHVLVIHYSFFNIQSLKVARCYYNEAGEYSLRHDCSLGVSFPPPLPLHTRTRSQLHVHAHVCVDKPAQIHAHAHKQLDVYLRCDLSQFAEDLAVLVRKKISFEKKRTKKKIGIHGASQISIKSSSIFYINALFIS